MSGSTTDRMWPFQHRVVKAGEVVFEEGEQDHQGFIIESGAVEISTEAAGSRQVLNELGPGQVLGELALLDDSPHSATATARIDTVLTAIHKQQVDERLEAADPVVRMLLQVLIAHFRSELSHARGGQDKPSPPTTPASGPELEVAVDLIRLESELRAALEDDQFRMVYQPIIDMASGETAGFEALIRWQSPTRGAVSPGQFIPAAEASSVIVPIGAWIMKTALASLKTFRTSCGRDLFMSVNIAERQIADAAFFDHVLHACSAANIEPRGVKLEIVERCLSDETIAEPWFNRCAELGTPVALDDFGTGYSSLQYLNKYAPDTLKIDQSFVRDMDSNENSRKLCRAIIDLAGALGMSVVAEGVETTAHADLLRDMGCGFAQGYLYAKPLPEDEVVPQLN